MKPVILLSLLTLAGCVRETRVIEVNAKPDQRITATLTITNTAVTSASLKLMCHTCDVLGNPNNYKVVTDGDIFKFRKPDGLLSLFSFETRGEAERVAEALADSYRDSCNTHINPKTWQEVK